MTGALLTHSTPNSVPAINAASVGGRNLFSWGGHMTTTDRVTIAMSNAPASKSPIASGHALMVPTGPPETTSAPMKGRVCTSMMMIPMPDMNPDITEYGV